MLAMQNSGICFDTRVIPASVEKQDDGLVMTSEDGRRFGPVDCVLWAIGREPNSDTLALDVAVRDGRIKRGDLMLLEAFGGGFTWGSALVRY